MSVDELHRTNLERQERFPRAMLAATTHDTKRSADTRARLTALAGDADRFVEHVARLVRDHRAPRRRRRALAQRALVPVPDPARHVADHGRPARRVPREGAPRGQGHDLLDGPGPRLGAAGADVRP